MKVQIKGLRINYTVSGQGNPVVVLHGWGKSSNDMKNVSDEFSKTHLVYSIDLPGFGLSEKPEKSWDVYDYEDCVTKFIQYFNMNDVILVGHSLGGAIALCMAYSRLINIRALFLIASNGIKRKKKMKEYAKIALYKTCKQLVKAVPATRRKQLKLLNKVEQITASTDYINSNGVMRDTLVKVVNTDIEYALSKIIIPTVLIWGENDDKVPLDVAQQMNEQIRGSRLKIIKNAAHEPFNEAYQEFANIISNEIKRI